jgi:multidrug efflux pump subunit AcrA (membrane-fusion protein)
MTELEQFVEQAEREAAQLEARLKDEPTRLAQMIEERQRRLREQELQLAQLSEQAKHEHQRELATRARLELFGNVPSGRPAIRGLSRVAGAAVCSTLVGLTTLFGGCWVWPIAFLAGRFGRDLD